MACKQSGFESIPWAAPWAASTSADDALKMVFLPPDPHLIKGRKAGTIAEYIYIYIYMYINRCVYIYIYTY